MIAARIFDEFKFSYDYSRFAFRMMERYASIRNLPDGSENQQMVNYNPMYMNHAHEFVEFLDENYGSWRLRGQQWPQSFRGFEWDQEILEHMEDRARFLLHMQTPEGVLPLVVRGGGQKRDRPSGKTWFENGVPTY